MSDEDSTLFSTETLFLRKFRSEEEKKGQKVEGSSIAAEERKICHGASESPPPPSPPGSLFVTTLLTTHFSSAHTQKILLSCNPCFFPFRYPIERRLLQSIVCCISSGIRQYTPSRFFLINNVPESTSTYLERRTNGHASIFTERARGKEEFKD